MKEILLEDINKMKTLMSLDEDMIPVSSGGYTNLSTDDDGTATDKINRSLLDDLGEVASKLGLQIKITTAKTGHPSQKSRHSTGAAVDIAKINGIGSGGATNSKNGNAEFRALGDKVVAELEKMGYKRNTESGHERAVLWQTDLGGNHYNHIHVSNTTDKKAPVKQTDPNKQKQQTDSKLDVSLVPSLGASTEIGTNDKYKENWSNAFNWVQKEIKPLVKALEKTKSDLKTETIREAAKPTKFLVSKKGEEAFFNFENGKVVDSFDNCENSLTIAILIDGKSFYVEYCGLDTVKFQEGEKVKKGDKIGVGYSQSVYGRLYDDKEDPIQPDIIDTFNKKQSTTPTYDLDPEKYKYFRDEKGLLPNTSLGQISQLAKNLNPFAERYGIDPETGKPIKVQAGIFGSTKTDSDTFPKTDYKERIQLARTPQGAMKKGLKVYDTRKSGEKGSKYLQPKYTLTKPEQEKVQEEINQIKKLLK